VSLFGEIHIGIYRSKGASYPQCTLNVVQKNTEDKTIGYLGQGETGVFCTVPATFFMPEIILK